MTEIGLLRPDVPDTVSVNGHTYTREDSLGAGSTGDVFLARDSEGNSVVIKFYGPGELSAQRHEINILMRLRDLCDLVACSIVAGIENDIPFLVIELVENAMSLEALSAWTAPRMGEPRVQRLAGRIMLAIVHGVAQLHANGVAHLDLHAGNVLLVANGLAAFMEGEGEMGDLHVRIIDFDRSVVIGPTTSFDSSGLEDPVDVVGPTDPAAVRTDVWQLGALAAWLTTGTRLMLADPPLLGDLEGLIFSPVALRSIARGDYLSALKALGNSRGRIAIPAPFANLRGAMEIQPEERMSVGDMLESLVAQWS